MAFGLAIILTRAEKKSAKVEWDFQDWMPKADPTVYKRMQAGIRTLDMPPPRIPQEH
jgi:hypothetical protein